MSSHLTTALGFQATIHFVVTQSLQLVNASSGGLFLYRAEDDTLEWTLPTGRNVPPAGIKLKRGQGVSGTVWEQGTPLVVADYRNWSNRVLPFCQKVVAGIPVQWQGQFLGVLNVSDDEDRVFTEKELQILTTLATLTAQIILSTQQTDHLQSHLIELETKLTQNNSRLVVLNEQLHELDLLKNKFILDMSHELRTPVTTVSLYLDLLRHGKVERQGHYLQILRLQVDRLKLLIEDILDLSRLELTREPFNFKPTDVNNVVQQVVEMFQFQASAAGLRLQSQLTEPLPQILGDEVLLVKALTNLVKNAIYYTPQGSVQVMTQVDLATHQLVLTVQDSGTGIDLVDMPHLFRRFYRGHKVGQSNIPGTGLGLAICQEIVHRHHGTIEVKSDGFSGSTFTIWLPLLTVEKREP